MIVLKKSDQEEKFDYQKLAGSIKAAMDETDETLDIDLIMAEFQNIVLDKEDITTGQINVIVYGLLYSKGAVKTLERYAGYKNLE